MRWYRIRLRRPRRSSVTKHYTANKEAARQLVKERLEHWNRFYGFAYKRIAIRNQRRCWGSCSELGNLNFSYKLLFLPQCLSDYIIVHELCHLRELNHSRRFWDLVEQAMPDYKERRKALRQLEYRVGGAVGNLEKEKTAHSSVACAYCMK